MAGSAWVQVEAGVVMEEIGRNLTPSPFLTTAVVGVTALAAADDDARDRWLPGIVEGGPCSASRSTRAPGMTRPTSR